MRNLRVLVAGEHAVSTKAMSDLLTHEGCMCSSAASVNGALRLLVDVKCDVVLCGVRCEGGGEFELLERIKSLHPDLPVVVWSETASVPEAVSAMRHGAFQYTGNLTDGDELLALLTEATLAPPAPQPPHLPAAAAHASLDARSGEGLVRESASMQALAEAIALVADSSAPVLILGETGTGKERVARAIHAGGGRANGPFVAVNMSAIPDALLESEVFGHVRGAFTGATQARRGLLLEAHRGTLLLDEIGDMPLALQPKLLRVLQFGEVRPVGSDRVGHVDVRIIAATHRDLEVLVRDGRFRDDLRHRLSVIPLVVPPLRQRREDIPLLIETFLMQARMRSKASPVTRIDDEAMAMLREAAWCGNVRELENTIERLVVLGRSSVVTVRDLAFMATPDASEPSTLPEVHIQSAPPQGDEVPFEWPGSEDGPPSLREMGQQYVRWVLGQTRGDKARAAQILEIDLSTLYRWERAKRTAAANGDRQGSSS